MYIYIYTYIYIYICSPTQTDLVRIRNSQRTARWGLNRDEGLVLKIRNISYVFVCHECPLPEVGVPVCVSECVCECECVRVSVCVREREKDRERENVCVCVRTGEYMALFDPYCGLFLRLETHARALLRYPLAHTHSLSLALSLTHARTHSLSCTYTLSNT